MTSVDAGRGCGRQRSTNPNPYPNLTLVLTLILIRTSVDAGRGCGRQRSAQHVVIVCESARPGLAPQPSTTTCLAACSESLLRSSTSYSLPCQKMRWLGVRGSGQGKQYEV